MSDSTEGRRRAVATAARLFQRQGYAATGLRQVLDKSGAPKGSFYHYFPQGKEQLATEAVRLSDAQMRALIDRLLADNPEPATAVRALAATFAEWLERSGYAEGCPITTVALEQSPISEPLRGACADAFESWQQLLADHLVRAGVEPAHAGPRATLVLCALEGAFVIAKATRSTAPFDACSQQLTLDT